MKNLTVTELKALEKSDIITVKGISGKVTTPEVAAQAPQLCQIHASSGNVYDIEYDGDTFTLIPNSIVYEVA